MQFVTQGESLFNKGEKKRDTQFRGRTWVCMHSFMGTLHSCFGSSSRRRICFVLCSFADGVETFCLTLRSRHFGAILSQLCWVVALP
jgi:hypothetical protein